MHDEHVHSYRRQQYLRMGFGTNEAERLAVAHDPQGLNEMPHPADSHIGAPIPAWDIDSAAAVVAAARNIEEPKEPIVHSLFEDPGLAAFA